MTVTTKYFKKDIIEYTLKNINSMSVKIINIGAAITEINVPDNKGNIENIVLGYANIEDYLDNPDFLGAIIGPVAGRIKDAEFKTDKEYNFSPNEGRNLLHSGGFTIHNKYWKSLVIEYEAYSEIQLMYQLNNGFPGDIAFQISYRLDDDNTLSIKYHVKADNQTIVAPTNHTYFNLSGNCKYGIGQHQVMFNSTGYLDIDNELIPLKINPSEDIFDLSKPRPLSEALDSYHSVLIKSNGGYDHYFIFDKNKKSALITDPKSGRQMKMETDFPGMVFYTGNSLDDTLELKEGKSKKHLGFCMEAQDSPAGLYMPELPDIKLEKDQLYERETKLSFRV